MTTKIKMALGDDLVFEFESPIVYEPASLAAVGQAALEKMAEMRLKIKQAATSIDSADEGESSQLPEDAKIQVDSRKTIMPAEGVTGMFQ